jgi:polysaccharide export outer membrane protein
MRQRRIHWSIFFASVLLLVWGCAGKNHAADIVEQTQSVAAAHNVTDDDNGGELPDAGKAVVSHVVPPPALPLVQPEESYRIGEEDALAITVYAEDDLSAEQSVRPDGKIAFPLIGDVVASGRTPDELRKQIEVQLSQFVKNPRVTVVVTEYNSKKIFALGELRSPGTQKLGASVNLLEGISRAGGVTPNADLRRAMLVRNGEVLPVSFEKLLRQADLTQNVALIPDDVILVPDASDKKVFVLGEVRTPMVITLRHDIRLIEAVTMAGGFTRDAKASSVIVVRGGLAEPQLFTVDVDGIARRAALENNLSLQAGDIVYVPETAIANIADFFNYLRDILTPVVLTHVLVRNFPGVISVQSN